MAISYFDGLIIYMNTAVQGERTIFSLLHILMGKKSSQTIQDARLYNINNYFGVYPRIERERINNLAHQLVRVGYFEEIDKDTYISTDEGLKELALWRKTYPLPLFLKGWDYKDIALPFWSRLHLLVQTISCIGYGIKNYIPVQRNEMVRSFVKRKLLQNDGTIEQLSNQLYDELRLLLQNGPKPGVDLFLLSLSGGHRSGLTIEQISNKLNIDKEYSVILFWDIVHYIVGKSLVLQKGGAISSLIPTSDQAYPLTLTAQKTMSCMLAGLSVEEMSVVRGLKKSTIEDHLVEIATFVPTFLIEEYVSNQEYKDIIEAINIANSKQLRMIKSLLPNSISYFQIRLVLAKEVITVK